MWLVYSLISSLWLFFCLFCFFFKIFQNKMTNSTTLKTSEVKNLNFWSRWFWLCHYKRRLLQTHRGRHLWDYWRDVKRYCFRTIWRSSQQYRQYHCFWLGEEISDSGDHGRYPFNRWILHVCKIFRNKGNWENQLISCIES